MRRAFAVFAFLAVLALTVPAAIAEELLAA